MRNFMYACIAIAALSFAIHCWVQPAIAQAPGNPIVTCENSYVYAANGDAYLRTDDHPWLLKGNVADRAPDARTGEGALPVTGGEPMRGAP